MTPEQTLQAAINEIAPGSTAALALAPPKNPEHGDLATPVALVLQKDLKAAGGPREIAQRIADRIKDNPLFSKVEIAAPGYLNITLAGSYLARQLAEILNSRETYGNSDTGKGTSVLIEYVSANPTGPLHIGHARTAAIADTVANLLSAAGWNVSREFYVNDAGSQITNLGKSVWYRYAELLGQAAFPEAEDSGLYRGDYVKDLAELFLVEHGSRWLTPSDEAFATAAKFAMPLLITEQQQVLRQFGVRFNIFFHESWLHTDGSVDAAIADLRKTGDIYESDNALWLRSTAYGDDKDRVLKKSDGSWTYLAPDIAYHRDKLLRGYKEIINAWGADHHGYIPRLRASLIALGFDASKFHVILIQMVRLVRGGVEVKMSKRSGSFVTLQEVIEEVGPDAARYLMLTRSSGSGLDFDLDLAKKATNDNPVFYVQYGHARVCQIFKKASVDAPEAIPATDAAALAALTSPMERGLIKLLAKFPDEVALAASTYEPHRIPSYLADLVRAFHSYYSAKDENGKRLHQIVSEDGTLTAARLGLCEAVRIVLVNGLTLCGISAPEEMAVQ